MQETIETKPAFYTVRTMRKEEIAELAAFFNELVALEPIEDGVSAEEFAKSYRPPDKFKGFLLDPQRVLGNAQAVYRESGR